jgi:hypothetical protein
METCRCVSRLGSPGPPITAATIALPTNLIPDDPLDAADRSVHGAVGRGVTVLQKKRAARSKAHLHLAELVIAAARTVDVRQPYGDLPNPVRHAIEGKPDPPGGVLVQCIGQLQIPSLNVHAHESLLDLALSTTSIPNEEEASKKKLMVKITG